MALFRKISKVREIPKISYSLRQLPVKNCPKRWELNSDRAVLLLHDYQEFFFRFLSNDLRKEIIESTNLVIDWAIKHQVPTVLSGQAGYRERLERGILRDLWGLGMSNEANDTDFVKGLRTIPNFHKILKQRYSAFASTNLENIMRADRRDQMVICGVYGAVGITATAFDCVNKDIQSFIVPDAMVDFSAETHENTVNFLCDYTSDIVYSRYFLQGDGSN